MLRNVPFTLFTAGLLAVATAAAAADRLPVDTGGGSFDAQYAAVMSGLSDGKTYVEISGADQATVRGAMARIRDRLASAGSVQALSEADRVAVFNDQEVVNNILTKAGEDSRVICRREKKTGSHRPQASCLTVAERRRQQDQSQQAIRNQLPPVMPKGG